MLTPTTPAAPHTAPTPLRMVRPAEITVSPGSPAIVSAGGCILISLIPRTPTEAQEINKDLLAAGFQ